MAIRYELTWNNGRWRKMYRGKWFSHSGTGGKLASYPQALAAFKEWKERIDEQEDKPTSLQLALRESFAKSQQWHEVEVSELQNAILEANQDSQELRLIYRLLEVIKSGDASSTGYEDTATDAARAIANQAPRQGTPPQGIAPWANVRDASTDGTPSTISELVTLFIEDRREAARNGTISKSRFEVIRVHTEKYRNHASDSSLADSTTALVSFRDGIRKKLHNKQMAAITARDVLSVVKSLYRFADSRDWFSLPKILHDKGTNGFTVSAPAKAVKVPALDAISGLLEHATERERLYLCLALNCGMGPKDMADLRHDEIDFKASTVTRKRSKTAKHDSVPIVVYPMWRETSRLLAKFKSEHAELAITTENGRPMVESSFRKDGSVIKRDVVHSAWARLCKKAGSKVQLKALRKIGASLLEQSEHHRFVPLYLGHSASSMADKHYAAVAQEQFASAMAWLESQVMPPAKPKR